MQKRKLRGTTPPTARRKRPAGALPRKRRSTEDILNRIVEAATGEFKRHGFAGATTAAIARKAGVTEAQLFRCFESKANLFRETIFKPLDQHLSNYIDKYLRDDSITNLSMTADLYMTEFQQFITEHAGMLTSLLVAQTYDRGDVQGVGEINSLRTYFERGSARLTKTTAGRTKADPRLMVRLSFVAVLGSILFKEWIFPPGLASEKEVQEATYHFVMDGLGVDLDPPVPARRQRK